MPYFDGIHMYSVLLLDDEFDGLHVLYQVNSCVYTSTNTHAWHSILRVTFSHTVYEV